MVDHDLKRARAVASKNIAGAPGTFCYRCANCGCSSGQAYGPVAPERCYNCKYDLYQDPAEGPRFTEAELLHMQVWALKGALASSHREARSLVTYFKTGQMEPPYRTEHVDQWIGYAMRSDEEERAKNMRLRETWKDYDW